MALRQSQRDNRAERMPHHDRALDAKLSKGAVNKFSLLGGGPHVSAGPLAVAEARAVEDDDAMGPDQQVGNPAGGPVVASHRVAMDQHDRRPLAPVDVMQFVAVNGNERAPRRMFALGTAGNDD